MREIYDVTFVIVTYNSSKTLTASIESCIKAVQKLYPDTGKVVVYDNASTDTCPAILDEFAKQYPDIFMGIKGKQNLGFGCANNAAMRYSPSRMYALINPDVSFQPDVITVLEATLRSSEKIAIVCPRLLFKDGTIQPSVRRFPTSKYLFSRYMLGARLQQRLFPFDYHYDSLQPVAEVTEVDWAIGAFMLVSGEYVKHHGLFDERFFLYFEDVCLCSDVWHNGYKVLFQPNVSALHLYRRASTSTKFNYLKLLHTVSALKYFAKVNSHRRYWRSINKLLAFAHYLSETKKAFVRKQQVEATTILS